MTTEQKHQFKNLVDFIFTEENIHKYLKDRTSPDDPRKNLAEVKSEYYYEVSDMQHQLHVHGMIKLQHTGIFGKPLRRLISNLAIYIQHKPYFFV
jgi:hypothetical protein